MNLTKRLTSVLGATLVLLTACGRPQATSPENASLMKHPAAQASSKRKQAQAPSLGLIGTWLNGQDSVNFNKDGGYTLNKGRTITSGTFKIAGYYGQTLLLKLTNYNQQTPQLERYMYVTYSEDFTKLTIDQLGTFTTAGKTSKVSPSSPLLLANALIATPTNASEQLIGTWQNERGAHVNVTTNYNPDGSFERYSDASGMLIKGTYSIIINGNTVTITTNTKDSRPQREVFKRNNDFSRLTHTEYGITVTYYKNPLPTIAE